MALGYRYVPTLYGMQRVATRPKAKSPPSLVDSSMGGPVKVTPSNPTGDPAGDPATGAVIGRGGGEFGAGTTPGEGTPINPGPVIPKGTPLGPGGLPATGVEINPATGKWGIHHVYTPEQVQAMVLAAAAGQIATATTKRQGAIRQALFQLGWDPGQDLSKYTGYGSDLTPEDIAAAQTNPYSMLAGFKTQRAQEQADAEANVGARGLWSPEGGAWSVAGQPALTRYNANLGTWGTQLGSALGGASSVFANEYGNALTAGGQAVTASGQALPWWEDWTGPTQA